MGDIFERWKERLHYWMPNRSEDDSERDGLFSTTGEVHAFVLGLGKGFRIAQTIFNGCKDSVKNPATISPEKAKEKKVRRPGNNDRADEIEGNEWYWEVGYIIGNLIWVGVLVYVSMNIISYL